MAVITEQFLNITMSYGGQTGNKGYAVKSGSTINVGIYQTTNNRSINQQVTSSYSQTTVPIIVNYGRKADVANISGKLCNFDDFTTFLSGITTHNRNTLYNTFLPCTIVNISGDDVPDLAGNWMVDTFKIKRNIQKRDIIEFELGLVKWYESVPP
jgi:hypothetical protein